jgi:hypothetical protein
VPLFLRFVWQCVCLGDPNVWNVNPLGVHTLMPRVVQVGEPGRGVAKMPCRIPTAITITSSFLRATPHPLSILFALPPDIPEPPPPLTLPTDPAIHSQKRIRIALRQYFLAFPRVFALTLRPSARQLAGPSRPLYRFQRWRGKDYANGEGENGE